MTGAHPERVLTGTADENITHDEPEARTYSPMNIDASFDITVQRTPWAMSPFPYADTTCSSNLTPPKPPASAKKSGPHWATPHRHQAIAHKLAVDKPLSHIWFLRWIGRVLHDHGVAALQ